MKIFPAATGAERRFKFSYRLSGATGPVVVIASTKPVSQWRVAEAAAAAAAPIFYK